MLNVFLGITLALTADAKITIENPNPPAQPKMQMMSKVESAAVRYRVQVYQTFRTNRAEFDSRQSAGRELLKQWKRAGRPADFETDVVAWFEDARAASTYPQIAGIPSPIELPEAAFVSNDEDTIPAPNGAESEMDRPEIKQPEIDQPTLDKSELDKPELDKPELDKPELDKPEIHEPATEEPTTEQPATDKPELKKPELKKPEIDIPEDSLDDFDFEDDEFTVPVNQPGTIDSSEENQDPKPSKVLGVIGRSIYKSLPGTN